MIESRLLDALLPVVESHAIAAIAAAELATGMKIQVTCTYRDKEKQEADYAQGRTTPGHIITHDDGSLGGPHMLRVALDIVPCIKTEHGLSAQWETDQWETIANCFKAEGFEWGGDWHSFKDRPHFQFTQHQTLAQIRAGETVTDGTEA